LGDLLRILLVQVDGKLPNLALMKISSFHKSMGDKVVLQKADLKHKTFAAPFEMLHPEMVYISVIFAENLELAEKIHESFPKSMLGGPGLGRPNYLPEHIEHLMPDYDLYGIDYSLGFTSRGCINNCGFCIVPKIEGKYREWADISEFHHPDHKKIVLWDGNILAGRSTLEKKFNYIHEHKLKISINQGLDGRLTTPEIAEMLAKLPCYDFFFKSKRYYYAWDLMENEGKILEGIKNAITAGIKPYTIMSYVLVGYNTTHEEDLYRFTKLRELEIDPFIMVYNNRRDDPWIRHFARFVNKRVYKACSFEEYNNGVLIENNSCV